ncbi:MAG: sigma 54-interacting transcriptional regulator [Thermodesulfobacteriota bacterium]
MIPSQQTPEFWKTILDIMTEGVMLVENGGKILFVNRAMEGFTGYSRHELLGKTCAFLDFDCCPRDHSAKTAGPCPLFKYGRLSSKTCSLKRRDGSRLIVVKNAQVIDDAKDQFLIAVEVQSDLTALREKEQEISQLRRIISEQYGFDGMVGRSPAMRNLFDLIEKAAESDAPVLIYGESGTGKELVASAIHKRGRRSKGPFIRVNCAVLSDSLLESELFGHVKGAFTGADRTTKGRFEAAHKGDIFLDEIGDVPLSTQVKLLRVLQEKEFERVGDYRPVPIDVRIVAATHRDLRALIRDGLFREDLFYRLNVIPIFIPPLRERPGDIPLLVEHFVSRTAAATGKPITGVDREAMDVLTRYLWPGNVRELTNAIEYSFVVCIGDVITRSDLPDLGASPTDTGSTKEQDPYEERARLVRALVAVKGKRSDAARLLGVSRQTLWSWMKKYQIDLRELLSQNGEGPTAT